MPKYQRARHAMTLALPVGPCQMLFTPAGEELWVEGWRPCYHHPPDGRTCEGMVFATGAGEEHTLWSLVDFERGPARYRARYSRVTPALRSGLVEVVCEPLAEAATRVQVSYEMTALTPAGEASLQAYEPEPFARMIEGWRAQIEARLPALAQARIR
jgi:hypothetical protein